jgi:phosphate transport system permease protein
MALDLEPAPPHVEPPTLLRGTRRPGSLSDRGFRSLAFFGGLLVFIILALILYSTTTQAWPAFRHEGLDFLLSANWNPAKDQYGALAFIYGTVAISLVALVLAVPVSIGIALFATELAPRRMRTPIIYVVDLLAAIPSVVFGLWGILVLAPGVTGFYENLSDWFHPVPILGTIFSGHPITGRSLMTAGLILAIMITPIVTAITREVFATTPVAQKEAALALGATRWEMIRGAVFPHGRRGVVSAVLIGMGRAMGETIAVALVIGSSPQITARLLGSGDSMAAVIVNQFGEAESLHRSALIGLGVALFLISLMIGLLARAVVGRTDNTGSLR